MTGRFRAAAGTLALFGLVSMIDAQPRLDAQARLDLVRKRRTLVCGVTPGVHGFATVDERGRTTPRNRFTSGNGRALGLDEAWGANVIKAVGNYGEIFERNVGGQSRSDSSAGSTGCGPAAA